MCWRRGDRHRDPGRRSQLNRWAARRRVGSLSRDKLWRISSVALRGDHGIRPHYGDEQQKRTRGAYNDSATSTKHTVSPRSKRRKRLQHGAIPSVLAKRTRQALKAQHARGPRWANTVALRDSWRQASDRSCHLSHCPLAQRGLCISLWITSWITRQDSWIAVDKRFM